MRDLLQTRRTDPQNPRPLADLSSGQAPAFSSKPGISRWLSLCVLVLSFSMVPVLNSNGHGARDQRNGAQLPAKERDSGSQKERDWKALDQRWSSLIEQRRNPEIAKWNALDDDFHAFAKKYNVHLEEHSKRTNQKNRPAQNTAWDFAQCPTRDDVQDYRCNLFLGPKGVCRYVCVPLSQK